MCAYAVWGNFFVNPDYNGEVSTKKNEKDTQDLTMLIELRSKGTDERDSKKLTFLNELRSKDAFNMKDLNDLIAELNDIIDEELAKKKGRNRKIESKIDKVLTLKEILAKYKARKFKLNMREKQLNCHAKLNDIIDKASTGRKTVENLIYLMLLARTVPKDKEELNDIIVEMKQLTFNILIALSKKDSAAAAKLNNLINLVAAAASLSRKGSAAAAKFNNLILDAAEYSAVAVRRQLFVDTDNNGDGTNSMVEPEFANLITVAANLAAAELSATESVGVKLAAAEHSVAAAELAATESVGVKLAAAELTNLIMAAAALAAKKLTDIITQMNDIIVDTLIGLSNKDSAAAAGFKNLISKSVAAAELAAAESLSKKDPAAAAEFKNLISNSLAAAEYKTEIAQVELADLITQNSAAAAKFTNLIMAAAE